MARKKMRYTLRNLPPCPDPGRMHVAQDKDGNFWKYNRGVLTEAKLNPRCERNRELTAVTNAAGVSVIGRMGPFLHGISRVGLNGRVSGAIKRCINKKGFADYSELQGFEWQQEYPFEQLVKTPLQIERRTEEVGVKLELFPGAVEAHNVLVTHFYFDAVLLHGNPMEREQLRTEHSESELFSFEAQTKPVVQLRVDLPGAGIPWMMVVKVSCIEGRELAAHPRHYGMKVFLTG